MRPLRSAVESITDNTPKGPLGIAGEGRLIGGTGYFSLAVLKGIIPVQGIEVGYRVESHSVERANGTETHTFSIHAASKDVAKFVSIYQSSPSNIDIVDLNIEITDIESVKERSWTTLWEITTEVKE